ncbi:hypothetical protein [Puia dinghuensis]|uniref:Uncharacterized protein n=1 Tax=Puia dinghuensis TaxID=1792502 RepID=A0A8J2UIW1_9BACT|nr:hypothetical protein [Puia dinghuensis]GGB24618.1 hypothetical protein GCM10011511_55690 [Puia dinghuensis]
MENNQEDSFLQMHLDYDGGHILHETVRWSRFLSIVGMVVLAICVLAFALAGTTLLAAFSRLAPGIEGLEGLGPALLIVAVLLVVAIFGFVVFMLYRFSVLTRRGIEQQDQAVFAEGMKCLKIYFLTSGILALLGLLLNLFSLTTLFHS